MAVVKLSTLGPKGEKADTRYGKFFSEALAMAEDEAVLVDVVGLKALHANVGAYLLRKGLQDKLTLRMIAGKTYLVKAKKEQA